MIAKAIIYFGKKSILACDGNCQKAWGINSRPKNQLSYDADDYEYLSDSELGDAPEYPDTYEGGDGKPDNMSLNKWCARECERSVVSDYCAPFELPNFSKRIKNKPTF